MKAKKHILFLGLNYWSSAFFKGCILALLTLFCLVSLSNAADLTRQERIDRSPQWNGEQFQNLEPVPSVGVIASTKTFWNYFFNKPVDAVPKKLLPSDPYNPDLWSEQQDLKFSWLGHATFLIKLDNIIILTDPMFSQRAGSFGWLSPKRYSKTITSTKLMPELDVVLITHNHYDHLDEDSIKEISSKTKHFVVPLAVGEILEEWGVSPEKITELDWWEIKNIDTLTITATPARHTSERGMLDKNKTLWASYGIQGGKHNLYLSGDSGWHKALYEIDKRLGPFDVTFFDIGAYGDQKGWKEIHYTPEEAIEAHRAIRGKVIVPSGWGTFDLALFSWHEPIDRFLKTVKETRTDYLTPKIGEVINYGHDGGDTEWWKPVISDEQPQ